MTLDQLKLLIDEYGALCESVGRHPFYGTAERDVARARIERVIDSFTSMIRDIAYTASSDSPLPLPESWESVFCTANSMLSIPYVEKDSPEEGSE